MPIPTLNSCRVAIAIAFLSTLPLLANDYRVISENSSRIALPIGNLIRTETVVQAGPNRINRFTIHRLRREHLPSSGSILLLPPLGNNFETYLTHPDGDIIRSFAGYLVRAGYEVWGYSPRETGIQAGDCAGGLDCSPALNWTIDTVVGDVRYIRSRIAEASPGSAPVIGGLSLGAISSLAVVNANPESYAGLLAWEGSIVTDDLAIRAHNATFCDQFRSLVSSGVAVDDQSLPFVKLVANLASTAPGDPFLVPVAGFPPGLTNRQALVFILSTPNPFAPSPRPGFISAAGDVGTGQFLFSEESRLIANISDFNDVTTNAVSRDLYCSLAGKQTKYSDNLSQFRKPVLIIKAGQGFGPIMDELPGKLASTSVSVIDNNGFGHVDHFGAANHVSILEAPVVRWLRSVLP